ncbi:hypothetical protein LOTGIDRAFT_158707 [Lottia gigantea]|uniref:EGF-like domain-containing protein n=1 Tax=Lottia gigantea TaxID=225164 RepID=V4AYK8_LOTGI|nr:hypothetical protein LOTGIDRAFT_158707 [Lottia gigantea]ESO98761.1 hypothetical protein LOTGIDRAFT_158707 [Lottia gigantea]
MEKSWYLLTCFLSIVNGFRFPTPSTLFTENHLKDDEGPLLAVLDFNKRLQVLNTTSAKRIAKIGLLGGNNGASANINFNYEDGLIYWTDVSSKKVYSLNAETGEQKVILEGDLRSPEGLTYDWIHKNCYVCDPFGNKIVVFNTVTGLRKTLIEVENPKDVAADPRNGWLYIAHGWESTARISRSGLNGENMQELTARLEIPYSISLDFVGNKLYYTDWNKILSMKLNGERIRTFYRTSGYDYTPNTMTVSREYVFWTTSIEEQVRRKKKRGSTRIIKFNALENYNRYNSQTDSYMGIVAIHSQNQPATASLCGDNNGGCSHFCLPSPVDLHLSPSFTCHCPDDMELTDDNKTCDCNM